MKAGVTINYIIINGREYVYRECGGNRVYSIQYTTINSNISGRGIESEDEEDKTR